jgi:hypothetical protein
MVAMRWWVAGLALPALAAAALLVRPAQPADDERAARQARDGAHYALDVAPAPGAGVEVASAGDAADAADTAAERVVGEISAVSVVKRSDGTLAVSGPAHALVVDADGDPGRVGLRPAK